MAPVSLTCSMPFSFTMTAAPLPEVNISAKTSLPWRELILPSSMRFTSSSRASGGDGQSAMGLAGSGEGALEVVEDPVGDALGLLRAPGGGLEIAGGGQVVGEDGGVVLGDGVFVHVTGALFPRQLGLAGGRILDEVGGLDREEVRVGEVAVVVRAFLDAHEGGFAAHVVPAAGLLLEHLAALEGLDLARDFKEEGAADAGDGVEILQLDLGAPLVGGRRAHGDVDVATELALFHVGVGDAAIDHDLLEDGEVGKGLLGAGDVGLADDLDERGAGAVVVDAGGAFHVEALGDILLEVDAGEADLLVLGRDVLLDVLRVGEVVERDGAAEAEGADRTG